MDRGVDRRICQTFAASPAEPGELLLGFRLERVSFPNCLKTSLNARSLSRRRRLCGDGPAYGGGIDGAYWRPNYTALGLLTS
jgi:hypothetical protein